MTKRIFISLILLSTIHAQKCGKNAIGPIASMKPDFGAIFDAFYSYGKHISDTLQGEPSQADYNQFAEWFAETDKVPLSELVEGIIWYQSGSILFWCLGFLLILASIVLCCVPKTCLGSPQPGKPRSAILGSIYLICLLIVLIFLLIGTLFYNTSTNSFVAAVDDGMRYKTQIDNDIRHTLEDGTKQIVCVLNESVSEIFETMRKLLAEHEKGVVTNTTKRIGFKDTVEFDYDKFFAENEEVLKTQEKLGQMLEEIPTDDQFCKDQIANVQSKFHPIFICLKTSEQNTKRVKGAMEPLTAETEKLAKLVHEAVVEAEEQMKKAEKEISERIESLNTKLRSAEEDIGKVMDMVDYEHEKFVSSKTYLAVRYFLRVVVNLALMMGIFMAIFAIGSVGFALRKDGAKMPRKLPSRFHTFFYISVSLTILLLLIWSFVFLGGWAVSATCKPIFEDPSHRLLKTVYKAEESRIIDSVDEFNLRKALESCVNPENTVFGAINGSNALSVEYMKEKLDFQKYKNESNRKISELKCTPLEVNTDQLKGCRTSLRQSYENMESTGIGKCENDVASKEVAEYLKKLKASRTSIERLSSYIFRLLDKMKDMNRIAIQENSLLFETAEGHISSAIDKFIKNFENNVFRCRPFVDIFDNCAFVICHQYGKPLHGLWLSIGLAACAMFILSILLISIYWWLKKEICVKIKKQEEERKESPIVKTAAVSKPEEIKKNERRQSPILINVGEDETGTRSKENIRKRSSERMLEVKEVSAKGDEQFGGEENDRRNSAEPLLLDENRDESE